MSIKTVTALLLALFLTLTHWGFWDKGVLALGWNASLFWLAFLGFLYHQAPKNLKRRFLIWVPLTLMALSFGLYEIPWLKFITMGVLPIATGAFYLYGQMENAKKRWWGFQFLGELLHHFVQPILKVEESTVQLFKESFRTKGNQRAKSIALGLGILVLLLIIVVLPLLSSADAVFAEKISGLLEFFEKILSDNIVLRILFFIVASIGLLAIFLGWIRPIQLKEERALKAHDDWVSGIVLGGLLATYLLFLYVQISYLFVGTLPIDLESTLQFVKSGFWQLFFLSILNGLLFFTFYRRTSLAPQVILKVFILASGLLLVSAGWRMVLYVTTYGFSYEKFFAMYTTVFGLLVFLMLLWSSFSKAKFNLFKVFSFMALWAFGVANVLPIEQIIMRSNMSLMQKEGSRIEMHELRMLSGDVYALAKANHKNWDTDLEVGTLPLWESWFHEIEVLYENRDWYEMNLSLLLNQPEKPVVELEE